jgi:hypothetical protein
MPTLWGSRAAFRRLQSRQLPFHVYAKSLLSSDLQAPATR